MPYRDREQQLEAQKLHYKRNRKRYQQLLANNRYGSRGPYGVRRKLYDPEEIKELAPTLREELIADGFVTTRMLGSKYKIPARQIRRACRVGELKARRVGQEYYIDPITADNWFRRRKERKEKT